MPRFTFKLQPLLAVRQAAEREKQLAVAALGQQRNRLERRLREQGERIAHGREALRAGLVGSLDAVSLRFHAGSTMRLMRDAQQMAVELAQIHRRLDQERSELLSAAAARRAIELLRDRQFAQWKRRIAKQEEAALDDLAGVKAAQKHEAFT